MQEFIDKLETFRPAVGELNEKSRDLDRVANTGSRSVINRMIVSVNDRWNELVGRTEQRQAALQDMDGQFEEYVTSDVFMKNSHDIWHDFAQDN